MASHEQGTNALLQTLSQEEQQQLRQLILNSIAAAGGAVTAASLAPVRQALQNRLPTLQISDDELIHLAQSVVPSADGSDMEEEVPPPPPPQVTQEEDMACLFDLLEQGRIAQQPLPYHEQFAITLKKVLAFSHCRPLARRVHRQLGHMSRHEATDQLKADARNGLEVVERAYNVIVNQAPAEAMTDMAFLAPRLTPGSYGAMLKAFDFVGVYVKSDPFDHGSLPPAEELMARVYDRQGNLLFTPEGEELFSVVQRSDGSRACAFTKTLKKCIYGFVREAFLLEEVQGAAEKSFVMSETRVAVKCIEKRIIEQIQKARRPLNENPLKEVACMQYLTDRMSGAIPAPVRGDSSRVLPVIECMEAPRTIYALMPCLREEMFSLVEAKGSSFPEAQCFEFVEQIVNGTEVLHSLGCIHHDMSLENLMLDSTGGAVIIDFGMVVKMPICSTGHVIKLAPETHWPGRCGKLLYLAPELLDSTDSFDPYKLDIWAIGVILFILITGVPPWDVATGPNFTDLRFTLVIDGRLNQLLQHWNIQISQQAMDLLQALLLRDPSARPSLQQIREFPWYQNRGQTH